MSNLTTKFFLHTPDLQKGSDSHLPPLVNGERTDRLNQIAAAVNTEHTLFEQAMRESLAHAVQAGSLLTEAKQLVKHGDWGKWIADHCEFSERSAQNYMRIAARFPELAKAQHVADLTYREAVGLLAEPKLSFENVSDLVRQSLELMRRAGKNPTALNTAMMQETNDKARTESEKLFRTWEERLKSDDLDLTECVTIAKQSSTLSRLLAASRVTAGYWFGKLLNQLKEMDTSNALREIHDKHLYRQTHKNFYDYCRERWGLERDIVDVVLLATGGQK